MSNVEEKISKKTDLLDREGKQVEMLEGKNSMEQVKSRVENITSRFAEATVTEERDAGKGQWMKKEKASMAVLMLSEVDFKPELLGRDEEGC